MMLVPWMTFVVSGNRIVDDLDAPQCSALGAMLYVGSDVDVGTCSEILGATHAPKMPHQHRPTRILEDLDLEAEPFM